jgi:hypothetical protein
MDPESFFVAAPEQSDRLPFLQVVRVPKGGSLRLVIMSTDVTGVRVHRVDGKPFLCPGEGCPIDGCPDTGRWQGYVEAIAQSYKKRIMFELTLETYHKIRFISVENGLLLRGLDLLLEREGTSRNAAISVTHMDTIRDNKGLGKERNLRPFILRLYKVL